MKIEKNKKRNLIPKILEIKSVTWDEELAKGKKGEKLKRVEICAKFKQGENYPKSQYDNRVCTPSNTHIHYVYPQLNHISSASIFISCLHRFCRNKLHYQSMIYLTNNLYKIYK